MELLRTEKFELFVSLAGEKPGIITDAQLSETIVWTLNATQKSLICKTTGDPEPRVIWTKDDKVSDCSHIHDT